MRKTTLKIDSNKKKSAVPEQLFGHFLEYMHDCIDPGLWAELLFSRGFENPDQDGDGISDPWICCEDASFYKIDTERFYAPRQAQYIKRTEKGIGGIQQKGLKLNREEVYEGYLWIYSSTPANVQLRIKSEAGNLLFEKRFHVFPEEWKKYSYEFVLESSHDNAVIQYLLEDSGEIWLDQTSLYPKEAMCRIWPETMQYVKALRPSIMRFPGGCAADCYDWKKGIGPRDKRPSTFNEHWGGIEQNQFGIDEYMEFCRRLSCEPLICVNFGSGTPEDAADWVEYCNGSQDTYYGFLRAKNGHPEPYKVKYWEIGNEVFGDWEIGHCDAESYAKKYTVFAEAMKKRDSNIHLLVCGADGGSMDQSWNQTLYQKLNGKFDLLSLHYYAPLVNSALYDEKELYRAVAAFPVKIEQTIKLTSQVMKEMDCQVPFAITEWNCNYGEDDQSGREQTLEAAVANAGLMNVFLRNSSEIEMCNISDLVNGWSGGIIRSQKGRTFGTATYHMLKLYRDMQPKYVLECEYNSAEYGPISLGNIKVQHVPYLDIVTCQNNKKEIIVFAVNRHEQEEIKLSVPGWNINQINELWEREVLSRNSFENPTKVSVKTRANSGVAIILKPHGIYALKLNK